MKKLSVKEIIEFRNKSARRRKSFIDSLKSDTSKLILEGGDYWVTCISAISNSYKLNDTRPIVAKRVELEEKFEHSRYSRTKIMYKRNIDILRTYETVNLANWRPLGELRLIKKSKYNSVILIEGLQIQATPNHVFSFKDDDTDKIGAIWFIAKLNGLKVSELGMFADILYRYLKLNFSSDYVIDMEYCIAVDVWSGLDVRFSQLSNGKIPALLNSTIGEIRKLL